MLCSLFVLSKFWICYSNVNILEAMSDTIQSTPSSRCSPVTALHPRICQWCVLISSRANDWKGNRIETSITRINEMDAFNSFQIFCWKGQDIKFHKVFERFRNICPYIFSKVRSKRYRDWEKVDICVKPWKDYYVLRAW